MWQSDGEDVIMPVCASCKREVSDIRPQIEGVGICFDVLKRMSQYRRMLLRNGRNWGR